MLDTAEKLRTASGVAGLPLGPNVHPVATITEYTLAAMGWGFPFIAEAVAVTIGPGCAVATEVYFCGIIDGELYNIGSQTNQVTFPGIQAGQEYCG